MKADKMFAIYKLPEGGDRACSQCFKPQVKLFVLADTVLDAHRIVDEGGGLCGSCMCETIVNTDGGVVTIKP